MVISVPKKFQSKQNNIVRVCLNKRTLVGSTNKNKNYKDLRVYCQLNHFIKKLILCLYVSVLLKTIAVIHLLTIKKNLVNLVYNISVKYTNKSFSQSYYLRSKFLNSIHIHYKKHPWCVK